MSQFVNIDSFANIMFFPGKILRGFLCLRLCTPAAPSPSVLLTRSCAAFTFPARALPGPGPLNMRACSCRLAVRALGGAWMGSKGASGLHLWPCHGHESQK